MALVFLYLKDWSATWVTVLKQQVSSKNDVSFRVRVQNRKSSLNLKFSSSIEDTNLMLRPRDKIELFPQDFHKSLFQIWLKNVTVHM